MNTSLPVELFSSVPRYCFKQSYKHFSSSINLRARSSWIAIETAAFPPRFCSVPKSSIVFRSDTSPLSLWKPAQAMPISNPQLTFVEILVFQCSPQNLASQIMVRPPSGVKSHRARQFWNEKLPCCLFLFEDLLNSLSASHRTYFLWFGDLQLHALV